MILQTYWNAGSSPAAAARGVSHAFSDALRKSDGVGGSDKLGGLVLSRADFPGS